MSVCSGLLPGLLKPVVEPNRRGLLDEYVLGERVRARGNANSSLAKDLMNRL